jgi:hypothetical protein
MMAAWIQEDTECDYSQREYGKIATVHGGDGENPRVMLIQGDDMGTSKNGFERVENKDWRGKIKRGFRII